MASVRASMGCIRTHSASVVTMMRCGEFSASRTAFPSLSLHSDSCSVRLSLEDM